MATDQEMLDRIAKLSTAIEQQKSIATNMRGNRGGYYTPPSRGRPNYTHFRGRGGNMFLSNTTPRAPAAPYYPVNISNKYINPAVAKPSTTSYISPPMKTTHNRTLAVNNQAPAITATTPTPTKSHNKNLIINHKNSSATTSNTMVKSIDPTTGRKQVAIDGVDFVVKGKKLIRKDLFDSNMTKTNLIMANSTAPKVLVRKSIKSLKRDKNKNMVVGKAPIFKRTLLPKTATRRHHQKGNMVFVRGPEGYVRQGRTGKSLVLNTHKRTIKKPHFCGFFTRYGKCPNGVRCPFVHDTNRRAICPRFLQNRCRKTAAECRLSHTPNPHIMPHCVHFQKGRCTNDPCMYAHVLVGKDAPVCKAFAMEGYCPKGYECDEKHVHVCPEFAETGKCSNANCRLPHVARRTANNKEEETSKKQAAGVVRLGSWVSPQYYHAQKMAKAEKRKAIEEAAAAKVWTRPALIQEAKEQAREKEEQGGFVRLFDDSDDDDGWSQYERGSDLGAEEPLRFRDDEEDAEEDVEEEDDDDEGGMEEEEEEEEEEEQKGSEENLLKEIIEHIDQDQNQDQEQDQDQDEGSDEDDFFDAVEVGSPKSEITDDDEDSNVEEVYEETSDTEMSDA